MRAGWWSSGAHRPAIEIGEDSIPAVVSVLLLCSGWAGRRPVHHTSPSWRGLQPAGHRPRRARRDTPASSSLPSSCTTVAIALRTGCARPPNLSSSWSCRYPAGADSHRRGRQSFRVEPEGIELAHSYGIDPGMAVTPMYRSILPVRRRRMQRPGRPPWGKQVSARSQEGRPFVDRPRTPTRHESVGQEKGASLARRCDDPDSLDLALLMVSGEWCDGRPPVVRSLTGAPLDGLCTARRRPRC